MSSEDELDGVCTEYVGEGAYGTLLHYRRPAAAGGGYGDGRVYTRTATPVTVTFVVLLLGCWPRRLAMGKATTSWIILVSEAESQSTHVKVSCMYS